MGLSPRTRGNQHADKASPFAEGSIPAHAGEPKMGDLSKNFSRVYPRARGGTSVQPLIESGIEGLSPRTRGNPDCDGADHCGVGSIPAHAGEPPRTRSATGASKVYPRARGGTGGHLSQWEWRPGLSPRTRGNRTEPAYGRRDGRSIPAHAGEPLDKGVHVGQDPVYPRARGGTPRSSLRWMGEWGLSPRTRGNHELYLSRC